MLDVPVVITIQNWYNYNILHFQHAQTNDHNELYISDYDTDNNKF